MVGSKYMGVGLLSAFYRKRHRELLVSFLEPTCLSMAELDLLPGPAL